VLAIGAHPKVPLTCDAVSADSAALALFHNSFVPQYHVQEQSCITPAPNEPGLCHVSIRVFNDGKRSHSSTLRSNLAGTHPSLLVVTAAPPTPGPPLHPSDAEQVSRMCQQLAQCVGSCDLHQESSSSGRQQHEHVTSRASAMQVTPSIHV